MEGMNSVSIDEATAEVRLVSRRIALLHMAFARAAIASLGEERGKRLIVDAIKQYGMLIGKEARDALMQEGIDPVPGNFGAGSSRSLPRYGMHTGSETATVDGAPRYRAYGCVMADVWHEYGEDEIGRLYCLVDPAKFMAFNPAYTMAHTKARPSGDSYCEFCVRETTPQEQADFASGDLGWTTADRCDREVGDSLA